MGKPKKGEPSPPWVRELISRGIQVAGSRRKLAQRLGISAPNITFYESDSTPSVQTLERLVAFLGGDLPAAIGVSGNGASLVREQEPAYGIARKKPKEHVALRCELQAGKRYELQIKGSKMIIQERA